MATGSITWDSPNTSPIHGQPQCSVARGITRPVAFVPFSSKVSGSPSV